MLSCELLHYGSGQGSLAASPKYHVDDCNLSSVLRSITCPRRCNLLLTLPSMKYRNHSGDQGSHRAGGSIGIGENFGARGGGPLGGDVLGGLGSELALACPSTSSSSTSTSEDSCCSPASCSCLSSCLSSSLSLFLPRLSNIACNNVCNTSQCEKTKLHNAMIANTTIVNANCRQLFSLLSTGCCSSLSMQPFMPKTLNAIATCKILLLALLRVNLLIPLDLCFQMPLLSCVQQILSHLHFPVAHSLRQIWSHPKKYSKNRFLVADSFLVFRSLTFSFVPIGATSNTCLRMALCNQHNLISPL